MAVDPRFMTGLNTLLSCGGRAAILRRPKNIPQFLIGYLSEFEDFIKNEADPDLEDSFKVFHKQWEDKVCSKNQKRATNEDAPKVKQEAMTVPPRPRPPLVPKPNRTSVRNKRQQPNGSGEPPTPDRELNKLSPDRTNPCATKLSQSANTPTPKGTKKTPVKSRYLDPKSEVVTLRHSHDSLNSERCRRKPSLDPEPYVFKATPFLKHGDLFRKNLPPVRSTVKTQVQARYLDHFPDAVVPKLKDTIKEKTEPKRKPLVPKNWATGLFCKKLLSRKPRTVSYSSRIPEFQPSDYGYKDPTIPMDPRRETFLSKRHKSVVLPTRSCSKTNTPRRHVTVRQNPSTHFHVVE